ncbi:MAG: hypothetical protein RL208_453, partial [Pseudomonadota bacterium]
EIKKNYKKSKLEQLTAFVYLIEEKSIVKVAKKMHISAASISMYIKSFEDVMKKTLFDRSNPKVLQPYPICDEIYQKAKQVVDLIDDIFVKIPYRNDNLIRISCHPLVFDVFLEDFIKQEGQKNKKLQFVVDNPKFDDAINDLLNGDIDFAIYPVHDDFVLQNSNIKYIDLWKYQSCIFAHKEHPIVNKPDEEIGLQDALGFRSVGFRNGIILNDTANILINTYTDCKYIDICDVLDTIKGITPMDAMFVRAIKKQKPDLINNIVIKNTSHLSNNVYFRILYCNNLNKNQIINDLKNFSPLSLN